MAKHPWPSQSGSETQLGTTWLEQLLSLMKSTSQYPNHSFVRHIIFISNEVTDFQLNKLKESRNFPASLYIINHHEQAHGLDDLPLYPWLHSYKIKADKELLLSEIGFESFNDAASATREARAELGLLREKLERLNYEGHINKNVNFEGENEEESLFDFLEVIASTVREANVEMSKRSAKIEERLRGIEEAANELV